MPLPVCRDCVYKKGAKLDWLVELMRLCHATVFDTPVGLRTLDPQFGKPMSYSSAAFKIIFDRAPTGIMHLVETCKGVLSMEV